jgi:hypothetical protein
LTWIVTVLTISQLTGPWTALAISTSAVIGAGVVAMVTAGDPRRRVRTMHASLMTGLDDPVSATTVKRLRIFAGCLVDADEALRASRISPTEHEMLWWRVYDGIAADRPTAART